MASCLGTTAIVATISSGFLGGIQTIRSFFQPKSKNPERITRIHNKNRRNSFTQNTNSNNRSRTKVETINVFKNNYRDYKPDPLRSSKAIPKT